MVSLLGVVVFLCAVGAAGLGLWSYQSVRGAAGPARVAAERFLDRLVAGDTVGAYGELCADTRRRWPQSEFTARVHTPPRLVRYAVRDVAVSTHAGQLRASVSTRLTHESGPPQVREVPVVRDGRAWRVCGDPF